MKIFIHKKIQFLLLALGLLFGAQAWATTWNLTAGQTTVVGTVEVTNDDTNVYVTYSLDTATYPGATFQEELHMWAGIDNTLVPKNPQGVPAPGQFCQAAWGGACSGSSGLDSAIGKSAYTFTIPWEKISTVNVIDLCNLPLYVYTHASVSYDKNGDGTNDEDTAWGGDIPGTTSRWFFYGIHTIECGEGDQPDLITSCSTAYAKGGYVWTTDKKSNPENLPSLKLTKNRWGWAINVTTPGTTTYNIWQGAGLNNTSKATLVGTLTINWNVAASIATVTYDLNDYVGLKEIHVYAGDTSPTTIAPGQYGYIDSFDPLTYNPISQNFSVTDVKGDGIWIVAHAVACTEIPAP